ncbi:PhoU domain-containing protein [Natrialba swarupiae]|uniref:Phosphate uptake regulator PhoU n=1 Tax=Natrialba swarupiae TaxID=2448032 RepID=A0A5D5AP87_9EURY|nr:PhoU domain-containing protein [Natrialba swarupiae]TYT62695.1 phosphate uptake regulator PhoU [Natrialba swarupiae]
MSNGEHPAEYEPVERKVQLAGNSTFVVSLPKEWARAQDLESGASMYLYPHEDRLIAAAETVTGRTQPVTVDAAGLDDETVLRRVEAAYVEGCDRITITDLEGLEPDSRRRLERSIGRLVGVAIQTATDETMTVTNVLDASEVSLPQTLAQIRQLTLEMYEDAIESFCRGDADLARRVIDRDDDVDRLFAFVSRGVYRGLEDVREINHLETDRTSAFREYRVADELERIADDATEIAAAATKRSGPVDDEFVSEIESIGAQTRSVVEHAFDGEQARVIEAAATARDRIATFDDRLAKRDVPEGYLYGTVVQRLGQTTEHGLAIADATVESTIEGSQSR